MNEAEYAQKSKEFKSLSSAFFPTAIVLGALDLGVFDALAGGARSANELASAIGADARALRPLLVALAALGYVTRQGDRFEASEFAARALVRGSAGYEGDSALMSLWFMRRAAALAEVVRRGDPGGTMEDAVRDSANHGAMIVRAMDQIAPDFAAKVRENVALEGGERVLDLGGAAGTFARALIADHPRATAVVYELPHAAEEARRIHRARGWDDRMRVTEGDFRAAPDLGGPYDVVFASNVFHLLDPAAAKELVAKIARALAPRGRLVVKDMVGREDGELPQGLATYAVLMLLISRGGALHDEASYRSWCEAAGLTSFRRVDCWERSSLLFAEKPSAASFALPSEKSR